MFGYVNIDKPNTLIKDYDLYKAHYCGVCKSLGKKTGLISRFSVNYDITFLSLLAHNARGVRPVIKKETCFAHPVAKKWCVVQNDPVQESCAYINTILGYYKIEDDILDNGAIKYSLAKVTAAAAFRRAKKALPDLALLVKEKYYLLRQKEQEKAALSDLALAFGDILAECGAAACLSRDGNLLSLLTNLGAWIYIMDAADDCIKDYADKKFNPFNYDNLPFTAEKIAKIYNVAFETLTDSEHNIIDAYDKMKVTIDEPPLSNVIYIGLKAKRELVLSKLQKTII